MTSIRTQPKIRPGTMNFLKANEKQIRLVFDFLPNCTKCMKSRESACIAIFKVSSHFLRLWWFHQGSPASGKWSCFLSYLHDSPWNHIPDMQYWKKFLSDLSMATCRCFSQVHEFLPNCKIHAKPTESACVAPFKLGEVRIVKNWCIRQCFPGGDVTVSIFSQLLVPWKQFLFIFAFGEGLIGTC